MHNLSLFVNQRLLQSPWITPRKKLELDGADFSFFISSSVGMLAEIRILTSLTLPSCKEMLLAVMTDSDVHLSSLGSGVSFPWVESDSWERLVHLRECTLKRLEALNHQQYFSKDSKNYTVNHSTQSQLNLSF